MNVITIVLSIILFSLLALNAVGVWWISRLLLPLVHFGGPYVPTRQKTVDEMVRFAMLRPSDRVADLGSGDGRIVIAAAKAGVADALGIEINASLVRKSKRSAERLGLQNIHFVCESFWKSNVMDRTVIFLFQVPYTMRRLESKLREELPIGARIVSNDFTFVDWQPSEEHGQIRIYTKTAPT
ncbi:hypothetical protein A2348_01240 [Candidatus Uhrbacteria bacterium RIFOXYB12_FULL_58_10]|uniref:Methyltransferase domain-containing protein n=1 Tax=Candidatus Uhrbacteria bacterium RIFOXYB2_FULL_57_15 TaxID=1802422 RepID=A0A1F7W8C4_9BACT|nr:MAG: hypothetical protein A2348_01240 [Candidatus Uhrbacteria bacterium RIFOXYB12_FULL_58_10]OGL99041.1 MAG: hypothetical protein A2304_02755 [Candidatus Uhrbacteria bacterium RIFOXYB2_FULL_57_15]OGM00262.1 MAG: hypothetical protein A2501_01885 [Candidatus Uhrbacteria bacterium RIFOXYC12_FULL_57_11]